MTLARSYRDLHVYRSALEAAVEVFRLTKNFPSEERYSMVDQMRRCSRSVCTNIAEAWRKRRYKAAFVAKLSDSETEASEMSVWMEFANRCEYINYATQSSFDETYDHIICQIVRMINAPDRWLIRPS